MSRSAPQVGKVVDQVSGDATERINAVLRYRIRTGWLEWPKPRASRACLERISSSKPTGSPTQPIGTDRPMALVQTRRQGLHQIRLAGIVGTRDGLSSLLSSRVNWPISEQHLLVRPRCGECGKKFSQKYLTIVQIF